MALRAHKPQPAKTAAIENITNELKAASSFIFTEYRGLSVEQITQLRAKLRENNCTYKVVRNNFARIAFDSVNLDVKDYLVGPTAVAMMSEDANAAAKTLFEFAKAFSKLPGKKELIAMFMSTVNATTAKFVRTLQAIVDKEGSASGSAPASAEA